MIFTGHEEPSEPSDCFVCVLLSTKLHRSFLAALAPEEQNCTAVPGTTKQLQCKCCRKTAKKLRQNQKVAEKLRKNAKNCKTRKTALQRSCRDTVRLHCNACVVTVSVYTATHTPRLATTCSPPYLYDHPQGLLGRVGHMICLFLHTRAPMAKQNHSNYDGKRILCGKWASDGRIS